MMEGWNIFLHLLDLTSETLEDHASARASVHLLSPSSVTPLSCATQLYKVNLCHLTVSLHHSHLWTILWKKIWSCDNLIFARVVLKTAFPGDGSAWQCDRNSVVLWWKNSVPEMLSRLKNVNILSPHSSSLHLGLGAQWQESPLPA